MSVDNDVGSAVTRDERSTSPINIPTRSAVDFVAVRRLSVLGLVLFLVAAAGFAGVGVWTTNGPPASGGSGPTTVIADSFNPGTLYSGDCCDFDYVGAYKSTDDGATWTGYFGAENPTPLATAPASTVYVSGAFCAEATCNTTVYVISGGGTTWKQVLPFAAFVSYLMVVDPVTPTTLFLAGNGVPPIGPSSASLLKSVDAGSTWVPVSSGLGFDNNTLISAMIGTTISGNLYVATTPGSQPSAPHGLFKTLDAGATWTPLPGAPNNITSLAADPTNVDIVYAGTAIGVFKSVDGGATFTPMNSGLTTSSVTSIAINPLQPANVFVGTSTGGVFRSSDGGATWQPMNDGLTDLGISTLAIDANGKFLHAATGNAVFDYQFPLSSCSPDTHTLCLNNGRFSVTATFQQTPEGPSAPATAVPLTSDTGYFWFFDAANVEMVSKVLNGCATNGHYWFFAGGLTNVGVQIKVKDAFTGAEQDYSNPVGTAFVPIQDTSAFATCP
jgi:photosystem II stability/assembly factor-like uncharacterized protein